MAGCLPGLPCSVAAIHHRSCWTGCNSERGWHLPTVFLCGKRTGIGVIRLPWRFGIWLLVVYYPSDEYRYGVIEGNYFSMWADDRHVIPIPRQFDDSQPHSSSPVLEGLLRNVFLMSKTWIELVENMATTHFVMEP